jgi:hypothetical protein
VKGEGGVKGVDPWAFFLWPQFFQLLCENAGTMKNRGNRLESKKEVDLEIQ